MKNIEITKSLNQITNERKAHNQPTTIDTLIRKCASNQYVFPEEYQRDIATTWAKFGKQYIETLLFDKNSVWNPPIHSNKIKDIDFYGDTDVFAIIDGQQRLTWIDLFFNGCQDLKNPNKKIYKYRLSDGFKVRYTSIKNEEFVLDLSKKSWGDVVKDKNNIIQEYVSFIKGKILSVIEYEGYSNEEVRDICDKINRSEPFKDQEKRNLLGGYCCTQIRGISRQNSKYAINGKFHPLFEKNEKNNKKGNWVLFKTSRMNFEKVCAKTVALNLNNVGACGSGEVDSMYKLNMLESEIFNNAIKHSIRQFDVVFSAIKKNKSMSSNPVVSEGSLFILCGVIRKLDDIFGNSKLIVKFDNPWKFFKSIEDQNDIFTKNTGTLFRLSINSKTKKETRTTYDQIVNKGYRTKQDVDWVFDQWNPILNNIVKNPKKYGISTRSLKRVISDKDKVEVYRKQNGKDAVSNKPVSIIDLEKGHIKSWSKGGNTNISNSILISSDLNKKMSLTSL